MPNRSRGNLPATALDPENVPDLRPLPQAYAPLVCDDPSNAIPFDMSILTISHRKDHNTIKALVVGGGIAGLAMAIMMDLAGIEYEILEKSTGDEPEMGSAIFMGPPVLRLMEQMNLLNDIENASKEVTGATFVDSECRKIGRVEGPSKERYGYSYRIIDRSVFHKILLNRVPTTSLHRGKAVVETLQNPNGVSCKCSDGSTYYGDIIVGADGAHSLTRERLYTQLAESGKLPDADMEPSMYEHVSLSGISQPLDGRDFPAASDEVSELHVFCAKEMPYSVRECICLTGAENRKGEMCAEGFVFGNTTLSTDCCPCLLASVSSGTCQWLAIAFHGASMDSCWCQSKNTILTLSFVQHHQRQNAPNFDIRPHFRLARRPRLQ